MSLHVFAAIPTQTSLASADRTASFRGWTKELHNAILAEGFTDTLSSGSITRGFTMPGYTSSATGFDSLNPPTTANVPMGFVVYAFADPLQSTMPIFFRIDYGGGSNTSVGVYLTVATSHSDSPTGTMVSVNNGPMFNSTQLSWGFSSFTSEPYLWFSSGNGTSSTDPFVAFSSPLFDIVLQGICRPDLSYFASIERVKTSVGQASPLGFVVSGVSTGGTITYQSIPSGSAISASADSHFLAAFPTLTSNDSNRPLTMDGNIIVNRIFPIAGISTNPLTALHVLGGDVSIMDFDILRFSPYTNISYQYMKLPVPGTFFSSNRECSLLVRID